MGQKDIVDVFKSRNERLTTNMIAERLGIGPREKNLRQFVTRCVRQDRLQVVDTYLAPGSGAPEYVYTIHPECDLWRGVKCP